jgi:hypothetical protein
MTSITRGSDDASRNTLAVDTGLLHVRQTKNFTPGAKSSSRTAIRRVIGRVADTTEKEFFEQAHRAHSNATRAVEKQR